MPITFVVLKLHILTISISWSLCLLSFANVFKDVFVSAMSVYIYQNTRLSKINFHNYIRSISLDFRISLNAEIPEDIN